MASLDFDIILDDYDALTVEHMGDGCLALIQPTDVEQWQGVERVILSVEHLAHIMRRFGPLFGYETKNIDQTPNQRAQFLEI